MRPFFETNWTRLTGYLCLRKDLLLNGLSCRQQAILTAAETSFQRKSVKQKLGKAIHPVRIKRAIKRRDKAFQRFLRAKCKGAAERPRKHWKEKFRMKEEKFLFFRRKVLIFRHDRGEVLQATSRLLITLVNFGVMSGER